jgi:hypothetical protein
MARKAFNFFASYFDVAKELNEKDRLAFYDALILEQFTGKKTDLKGMAKFAYVSQQHSIDAQINGFNQRLKRGDTTLEPLSMAAPMVGGSVGGMAGANLQEKEKEKEKVQYVSRKPRKTSFEESEIFDKFKFKDSFPTWGKEKLAHYYEAAERYSIEGNKYVSWKLAIKTWAKKDELKGVKVESEIERNKTEKTIFY